MAGECVEVNGNPSKTTWRSFGWRFHPELRRLLKSAAALTDETIEEYLHRLLCGHFERPDLEPTSAP